MLLLLHACHLLDIIHVVLQLLQIAILLLLLLALVSVKSDFVDHLRLRFGEEALLVSVLVRTNLLLLILLPTLSATHF